MKNQAEIMKELENYRQIRNMNKADLCRTLGINYTTLHSWNSGRRKLTTTKIKMIEELLLSENLRTNITIPLETLEEIEKNDPSLQPLLIRLIRADGTDRVSIIEKQIAEKSIRLPLSLKSLYGLGACLVGKPFRKE